jgi:Bacteriophage HK97-gp10, putative tail-component
MIDISFNMSELLALLDDIENHLPNAVEDALQECGQIVALEESKRTKGQLSKSFYTYKDGNGTQIVDNSKDYAQYLEYGRGPVTAIKAKALRFVINGEVIFRKSVGPMKAQPFVKESIAASNGQFKSIFEKHINKMIK